MASAASGSDPRLPSAAVPYRPSAVASQDLPPDYSSLVAIMLGIAGVMLRFKVASLLAIVFCAHALANMRNAETDLKQIVMAFTFAGMGLMTNYFGPGAKGGPSSAPPPRA